VVPNVITLKKYQNTPRGRCFRVIVCIVPSFVILSDRLVIMILLPLTVQLIEREHSLSHKSSLSSPTISKTINGFLFFRCLISTFIVSKEHSMREMITDSLVIADMRYKDTLLTTRWTTLVKSTTARWCVKREVKNQFHLHVFP
jgi:hypothetical protein